MTKPIASILRWNGQNSKYVGEVMKANADPETKEHGEELWRAGCMMLCWADAIEADNV